MSVPGSAPIWRLSSTVGSGQPATSAAPGVATVGGPSQAAPGEQASIGRVGILTAQLALLILVIRQFEIESAAFLQLTILTFFGFVVHAFLPIRHRMPCFLLLSLAGIGLVLGVPAGASLVAIGVMLVGICHLPVPFWARVSILAAAGGLLALMRAGLVDSRLPLVVWPILGSMFMFRLWVYMYDLKHDTGAQSPARSLSYFFLLPNVCFPLFPVVDFKAYRRTYYNEEASAIYQNGVRWMFRGVVHLILYRVVYNHLTITPAEVSDVPDLVRYLTSNFLLYLRVSGQFHLVVGMLHLFGFNLPPTHHLFYLASSFNDFWRRINIYWKDFMMKLFYYPAYFKLRKLGTTTALVLSTLLVFASTWILHSYQWFWLRGSFPLNWQDGVFWGVLAALVVINSLYEAKHGRTRSIGARAWTPASLMLISLKTFATFCCICVLWSLWTSESFAQWQSLWSLPGGFGRLDVRSVAPVALLGMVWFGFAREAAPTAAANGPGSSGRSSFGRQALFTTLSILAVYTLGQPAVYSKLGAQAALIESVRSPKLNARDSAQMEAGYYEGLLRVDRFNSQLWEVYMRNPEDVNEWGETSRTFRWTTDFRMKDLPPHLDTQLRERSFKTNQWGMRDREYAKLKPEGTRRFALLGSSVVMGSGVADGETFETLIEHKMNGASAAPPYEILNFGIGGYGPLEQMTMLDSHVFPFDPDAVIYVAHYSDITRAVRHLARAVERGFDVPYPELQAILHKAGAQPGMSDDELRKRLDLVGGELVLTAYRHIADETRRRGLTPVWVFVPVLRLEEIGDLGLISLAHQAGFHVIDLSDVWDGHDRSRLNVSEADYHPNREGHRLIAERMHRALVDLDARASLKLFATTSSVQ